MNFIAENIKRQFHKVLAVLMASALFLTGLPSQPAFAATPEPRKPVKIRKAPKRPSKAELTTPTISKLSFSKEPSDSEICNSHIFFDPLAPMDDRVVQAENQKLANTLLSYIARKDHEDVSLLTDFIKEYPNSRWRAALELNLGKKRFASGYVSEALKYWASSWEKSKGKTKLAQKAVADEAISNLVKLEARLGLMDTLEKHLAEISKRTVAGSAAQRVKSARDGLQAMKLHPEKSFRCGPCAIFSLQRVLAPTKGSCEKTFARGASTTKGTNLAQVQDWAKDAGMDLQAAKRAPGSKILVPSVYHLKIGHFGAITAEERGYYRVEDPTFDNDSVSWISKKAIEAETDAFFLVQKGPLPSGWSHIERNEAAKVWGKGFAPTRNDGKTPKCPKKPCPFPDGRCNAMARASAFTMNASLNIEDSPLQWHPPIGPDMVFHCNYNHGEGNQPSTFFFTNLGKNWSLNWNSYLTVDDTDPAHKKVIVRVRGGGFESYVGPYEPDMVSQAVIAEDGGTGNWTRTLPDGSVENFTRSNAANDTYFLTSIEDPQGNAATIAYGSSTQSDPDYFRIASIADACGNSATFTYPSVSSSDPGYYRPTSIADSFSRSVTFAYDSTNMQLLSITDPAGIKSEFAYDSDTDSSFINLMTSPYGSTHFLQYTPVGKYTSAPAGLKFTFADGTTTVIENWIDDVKETYFWDREAMALYPNDPANHILSHCQTTRWLWQADPSRESPVVSWDRNALEGPVVHWHQGEQSQNVTGGGTTIKDTQILKQLHPIKNTATISGTITAGNVLKIRMTDPGFPRFPNASEGEWEVWYTVQSGDSLTSIATGFASAINNDPILQAYGLTATSAAAVVTVTSLTTNKFDSTKFQDVSTGSPTASVSFANGPNLVKYFSLTTSVTAGDAYSLTVTDSGLPGGAQTFNYTAVTGDTPTSVTQSLAVAANANQYLQSQGISAVWTRVFFDAVVNSHDPPGSNTNPVIALCSDSANTTTYSLTKNSNSISESTSTWGLVQAWNFTYNNIGNVTLACDPVGRFFNLTYANNKIDLLQVLEREGVDDLVIGIWEYNDSNAPHRPTKYKDPSCRVSNYTYDSTTAELLTATDSLANTTTLSYDGAGYLTQVDGPLSGSQDVTSFTFYDFGLPETISDSEGYTLSYFYDGLNRKTSLVYPDGTSEKTVYQRLDAVMQSDRLGRWTQSGFDSLGQMAFQIDPLGRKSTYCWCDCGSLASLTDPANHTTKWHHDLQGRLIQKVFDDGSHYDYTYETTSRLSSMSDAFDPTPQTTKFTYNLDNSVCIKRYLNAVNATSQVVSSYDPNFSRLTSTSNGWGQLDYAYFPHTKLSGGGLPPFNNRGLLWIGGIPETPNATDTINLTFVSTVLTGGQYNMPTYTVATGDAGQPDQVATHLASAITSDSTLSSKGISASASGAVVVINGNNDPVSVNASSTGGTVASVGSAGRLSKIKNTAISNSQIDYGYDGIGRTTVRMINAGNNRADWAFDAMSRVTSEVDPLGTFSNAYVDNTAGSSKGVTRLASITYPNSQVSNFSWLANIGDQRLQQIANLNASAATLSQLNYAYNPAAEITQWQQQQNSTNTHLGLGYDSASQLATAVSDSGSSFKAYISGTAHTGDVVSVTAYDASLTGTSPVGQETASYTVQGGDTLSSIATALASQISSVMSNISVSASASGSVISITTSANKASQFTSAVTGSGATTTISLSGSSPNGNLHKQNYYNYDCAGNRTGVQGDSTGSFPTGLTSDATRFAYNNLNQLTGISAGGPIRFEANTTNPVKSALVNVTQTATIGGSITASDILTIGVHDSALSQAENVNYTVQGGDSTTSIATALKNAINADSTLSGIGVTATSSSNVITITSTSVNPTTYTKALSAGASETITLGISTSAKAIISPSKAFTANPSLDSGANTAKVTALSGGGTATTNSYPITINSVTDKTLTYDANGNMTSDGNNHFDWDADNRLVRITYPYGTSSVVATPAVGTSPTGIAITPNSSKAYVCNNSGGTVSVINTSNNSVIATVNVGGTPVAAAVTPDGSKVYVSTQGSVVAIDTATDTVLATIGSVPGPAYPGNSIAITPDGSKVYVPNSSSGTVSVINTSTNTVTASISVGTSPREVAIMRGGAKAYVSNFGSGNVSVINTSTDSVSSTVTVGTSPDQLGISPDGSKAYVCNWSTLSISIINTSTDGVVATVTTSGGDVPHGVAILPDSSKAYVVGINSTGKVYVIDGKSNTLTTTITVGSVPRAIAMAPDGMQAYVTNETSGTVSVISTNSDSVNSTVTVGSNPWAIATTSDATKVYAANNSANTVSAISTSANTSQFVYDPRGLCGKIVETTSSSVTSTKQHIWCGSQRCEERDASGSLSNGKQFFLLGQANFASGTPTNYFYTTDHLGSIREMTKTVSGTTTIEAQYGYDPYGQATKIAGSADSDFQYAQYYVHGRSGLNLTRTRAYSASLGRFISRDPIEEEGGLNLYAYCENDPIDWSDPAGTQWEAVVKRTIHYTDGVEISRTYRFEIYPDTYHGLQNCTDSCEEARKALDKFCNSDCNRNIPNRINCGFAADLAKAFCILRCLNAPHGGGGPDGGGPGGGGPDGGEPAPDPNNVIQLHPKGTKRKAS